MVNFYAGDVTKLSNAELLAFQAEIEDSGALREDIDYYDEGDWLRQAHDRYWELDKEKTRRWEVANPEEAERIRRRREPLESIIATAAKKYMDGHFSKIFESSDSIARLIKNG
jgi:hypothetical protein